MAGHQKADWAAQLRIHFEKVWRHAETRLNTPDIARGAEAYLRAEAYHRQGSWSIGKYADFFGNRNVEEATTNRPAGTV